MAAKDSPNSRVGGILNHGCFLLILVTFIYLDFTERVLAQPSGSCVVNLISPENDAKMDQRPIAGGKFQHSWRFSWSACPGASRYHLYVIGPNAQNPIINIDTLRTTSHLDSSTSYGITSLRGWKWRVRAFVGDEWGDWSETRFFDVDPASRLPQTSEICRISGRVTGRLTAKECRDPDCRDERRYTLREVILITENPRQQVAKTAMTMRRVNGQREWRYSFTQIQAGRTYSVVLPVPWRFRPAGETITCVPGRSHTFNVEVTGITPFEF